MMTASIAPSHETVPLPLTTYSLPEVEKIVALPPLVTIIGTGMQKGVAIPIQGNSGGLAMTATQALTVLAL